MAKDNGKLTFRTEKEFKEKIREYILHCETLEKLPNIKGCYLYLNIGKTTLHEYKLRYPGAYRYLKDSIEEAVWQIAIKSNPTTGAIFYLKTRGGLKEAVSIDNNVSGEINVKW